MSRSSQPALSDALVVALACARDIDPEFPQLEKRAYDLFIKCRREHAQLVIALNNSGFVFEETFEEQSYKFFRENCEEAIMVLNRIRELRAHLIPDIYIPIRSHFVSEISDTFIQEALVVLEVIIRTQRTVKSPTGSPANKRRSKIAKEVFLSATSTLFSAFISDSAVRQHLPDERQLAAQTQNPELASDFCNVQQKFQQKRNVLHKEGVRFKLTEDECRNRAWPREWKTSPSA